MCAVYNAQMNSNVQTILKICKVRETAVVADSIICVFEVSWILGPCCDVIGALAIGKCRSFCVLWPLENAGPSV